MIFNIIPPAHAGEVADKVNQVTSFFASDDVFGAAIFLGFLSFAILFYRAQKKENLKWTDLITGKGSNSVSLTKLLQLVGGVVATWIMIKQTLQGKLEWDLFAIYLAYTASIEGFSKFIAAKYGTVLADTPERPSKNKKKKEDVEEEKEEEESADEEDEEEEETKQKSAKGKKPQNENDH